MHFLVATSTCEPLALDTARSLSDRFQCDVS